MTYCFIRCVVKDRTLYLHQQDAFQTFLTTLEDRLVLFSVEQLHLHYLRPSYIFIDQFKISHTSLGTKLSDVFFHAGRHAFRGKKTPVAVLAHEKL